MADLKFSYVTGGQTFMFPQDLSNVSTSWNKDYWNNQTEKTEGRKNRKSSSRRNNRNNSKRNVFEKPRELGLRDLGFTGKKFTPSQKPANASNKYKVYDDAPHGSKGKYVVEGPDGKVERFASEEARAARLNELQDKGRPIEKFADKKIAKMTNPKFKARYEEFAKNGAKGVKGVKGIGVKTKIGVALAIGALIGAGVAELFSSKNNKEAEQVNTDEIKNQINSGNEESVTATASEENETKPVAEANSADEAKPENEAPVENQAPVENPESAIPFPLNENGEYEVKKGDCLYNITKAYLKDADSEFANLSETEQNAKILKELDRIMALNPELKWLPKGDIEKYYVNILEGQMIKIKQKLDTKS